MLDGGLLLMHRLWLRSENLLLLREELVLRQGLLMGSDELLMLQNLWLLSILLSTLLLMAERMSRRLLLKKTLLFGSLLLSETSLLIHDIMVVGSSVRVGVNALVSGLLLMELAWILMMVHDLLMMVGQLRRLVLVEVAWDGVGAIGIALVRIGDGTMRTPVVAMAADWH